MRGITCFCFGLAFFAYALASLTALSNAARRQPRRVWINREQITNQKYPVNAVESLNHIRRVYYVVTLDGVPGASEKTAGSFDTFVSYWFEKCKEIEFRRCSGVIKKGLKAGSGVGLTIAYAKCLEQALEEGFNQVVFLEDDARDFESNHTFCDEHNNAFANSPTDALVILFGGHEFHENDRSSVDTREPSHLKFVPVKHSFGTYGFGLPTRNSMRAIQTFFRGAKDRARFRPDVEWYDLARKKNWKIYATEPLLVRHPEYSWSSTWNCQRRSSWAWNRKIISDKQAIAERAEVDPSVRQHKGLCAKETQHPLEFIHITKTGGSSIEKAGASHGIRWGACHFNHTLFNEMGCPSPPDWQGKVKLLNFSGSMPWHVPLRYWKPSRINGKRTFTVVRNPYDRAISEFYNSWSTGYKGKQKNDPETLNRWIRELIARRKGVAFLPQHLYIGPSTKVLKFENLTDEFNAFMYSEGLPVRLKDDSHFNERQPGAVLNVSHLSKETIWAINEYASRDFEMFGYKKQYMQHSIDTEKPRATLLGKILHERNASTGVELGVQRGLFSRDVLRAWGNRCKKYVLVDLWAPQKNYMDGANVPKAKQDAIFHQALENTRDFPVEVCRDFTVRCAQHFADQYFDFIYVDARHDYKGVTQDLHAWFPKLKPGGIIAGHDYLLASDQWNNNVNARWEINLDGSEDITLRAVVGAVDDFFSTKGHRVYKIDAKNRWPSWMVDTSDPLPENRIPPAFHFIWIDVAWQNPPKRLPEQILETIQAWKDMNPAWTAVVWTNELFEFHFEDVSRFLRGIKIGAWAADIARYYILSKFGGLYLDTDIDPVHPLPSYLADQSFAVCAEYHTDNSSCKRVGNAVIGVRLDHRNILKSVAESALKNSRKMLKHYGGAYKGFYRSTGPLHLSKTILSNISVFRIVDSKHFFPCSWTKKHSCEKNSFQDDDDIIGMHRWDHSWA